MPEVVSDLPYDFKKIAVLRKKMLFFPVKGSKGLEGSKCLYFERDFGS
jgi:hypothetical protein